MKYIKALDIYTYGEAVRSGQIKLQSGQWIRLGPDGQLSRFHSTDGSHITAFHGYSTKQASFRYLTYVSAMRSMQMELDERKAKITAARAA